MKKDGYVLFIGEYPIHCANLRLYPFCNGNRPYGSIKIVK